jgi:hypothetical protein
MSVSLQFDDGRMFGNVKGQSAIRRHLMKLAVQKWVLRLEIDYLMTERTCRYGLPTAESGTRRKCVPVKGTTAVDGKAA